MIDLTSNNTTLCIDLTKTVVRRKIRKLIPIRFPLIHLTPTTDLNELGDWVARRFIRSVRTIRERQRKQRERRIYRLLPRRSLRLQKI